MTWFIDSIELIGTPSNVFTAIDIMAVLIISTILCFVAALTYKYTHDGISYSPSFVQTTVIFGVIVSMIMLIIGSNIARAFTLVGALSIIRFRNAIKETRDVGFIFFMMAIGMAVGTRFFILAFLMTTFICLLIIGMRVFGFASQKNKEEILKVVVPSTVDYEKVFNPSFKKYLDHHNLLNIEHVPGEDTNLTEITYMVRFKNQNSSEKTAFIHEIKKTHAENRVSLFGTEHLIY
jgi:uncharacterized membrane protein YhiD involved in acid resistance